MIVRRSVSWRRICVLTRSYSSSNNGPFRPKRISDMLLNFIKQEGKALEMAIRTSSVLDTSISNTPLDSLDPDIKHSLSTSIDTYAQLRSLLTYPATRVAPSMYQYLYEKLKGELEQHEVELLIRSFVYHRQYHQMWNVIFTEGESTLTDLENYIEIIHDHLVNNNYLEIGLLQILESINMINSETMRHTVLDIFLQKFQINREKSSIALTDLMLKKSQFELTKDPNILTLCTLPGSILFILSGTGTVDYNGGGKHTAFKLAANQTLLELIDQQSLNTYDIIALLNETPVELRHVLYKPLLRASGAFTEEIFTPILAYMLKNEPNPSKIADCLAKCPTPHIYPKNLVESSLVHIFLHSRNDFDLLAENYDPNIYIDGLLTRLPLLYDQRLVPELISLTKKLNEIGKLDEVMLKKILKVAPKEEHQARCFITELLMLPISSSNVVNTVVEFTLLECQLHNETIILELFTRILAVNLDKPQLQKQIRLSSIEESDDFRAIFKVSSDKDKQRLYKSLRRFANCLNNLETGTIIDILNGIHQYLFNPRFPIKFTLIESEFGKNYILTKLLQYILERIDQQIPIPIIKIPKEAITKMKDILIGLKFNSPECQALIYQYLVKYNPKTSIQLIETYKDKKALLTNLMMRNIMQGILISPRLNGPEKIHLYRQFRSTMRDLGYKSNHHSNTIIHLFELLHQLPEGDPNRDTDFIKEALKIARNLHLPHSLIQEWSRKLGY